ncbi:hypothetical protein [Alteriqipengyuania lutimaris]|uniref:hypothetical protein n=1 Tax=Alteriqipengyuania lutimaris TaxID=1538146 RepID=UPI0011C07B33|nr:hypothetical protein [Alteriqipengyuania lutimaris]MBB3035239.1 hypothetical protein [Alteriqipengyuania lutimaris]
MINELIIAITAAAVPGIGWLAYNHPSEFRRIRMPVAILFFALCAILIGWTFGVEISSINARAALRTEGVENWTEASRVVEKSAGRLAPWGPWVMLFPAAGVLIGLFLHWISGIKERDREN